MSDLGGPCERECGHRARRRYAAPPPRAGAGRREPPPRPRAYGRGGPPPPVKSVPFSISNAHHGFSEMRGTVCLEGDDVVIEVQVKLLSLFDRPPQSFRFDMTDLEEIRHTRRFWGDTVTLRTRPMDRVTEIPGAADGELCLKVKRAHRADLDRLLDRLEMWLA